MNMALKILLVYPEFPDTFWSFKHALKFIQKKAGAPPLGLLTVAATPRWVWKRCGKAIAKSLKASMTLLQKALTAENAENAEL